MLANINMDCSTISDEFPPFCFLREAEAFVSSAFFYQITFQVFCDQRSLLRSYSLGGSRRRVLKVPGARPPEALTGSNLGGSSQYSSESLEDWFHVGDGSEG